jgi:hypothetical protein
MTALPGLPQLDPAAPRPILDPARRRYLWTEFLLLFAALPLLVTLLADRPPVFILIWSAALVCGVLLLRDRTFPRSSLWNAQGAKAALPGILIRFAILGGLLTWLTAAARPDDFLSLPRERPGLWLLILVAYPVLSVWPQNLIYRALVLTRYGPLVGAGLPAMLLSAAAFSFGHIIFGNATALALTLVGGVLFARTYLHSRSLLAASIEHALYGVLAFTVGLGPSLHVG